MSMPHPPEKWTTEATAESVAVLTIPAALSRSRTFDIDVSLEVKVAADAHNPWHELVVEIDGRRQWGRRIDSHPPADGLDYHCRLTVEPDQELRLRAMVDVQGSRIHRLLIEAGEVV